MQYKFSILVTSLFLFFVFFFRWWWWWVRFSLSYDFSPAQHSGGPHPPANNYLPKKKNEEKKQFLIFVLLFQWKVWMMKGNSLLFRI